MSLTQPFRGQPLVALLAVLAGWMGGRISTWQSPLPIEADIVHASPVATGGGQGLAGNGSDDALEGPLSPPGSGLYPPLEYLAMERGMAGPGYAMPARTGQPYPVFVRVPVWVNGPGYGVGSRAPAAFPASPDRPMQYGISGLPGEPEWSARGFDVTPARFVSGTAAGSRMPSGLPPLWQLAAQPGPPSSVTPVAGPRPFPKRWSGDSWALLRHNGAGGITNGALPATYGASQTGAVLRYRLSLDDPRRLTGYMRTTTTLSSVMRETAGALGFSARPFPKLPVIAALEARLTEQGGVHRFQPAAMAITELPPFPLPQGWRGEAYGQAGYVGGTFATPFADGQFRADRGLFSVGRLEGRLGGGAWGGVQKGAGRLDAGPSATFAVPLGRGAFGRVAVDWRFRIAGDADPGSGPAVTLSAGF